MNIEFKTKHINKKLYQRMILNYIYSHYHHLDYTRYMEQDKWVIKIQDVKDFDVSFYHSATQQDSLDYSIPHGVTGQGDIICYITDSENPLNMLQNMNVICHELAHMILMIYYPNKLVEQRYDDFYGKKGTQRKFFSSEVHDRVVEGRVKQFEIRNGFTRRKVKYVGVDIGDITNSRRQRRI